MDRRESIKLLASGAIVGSSILVSCNTNEKNVSTDPEKISLSLDRTPEETEREKKLAGEKFFTDHEMATLTVLADIIIPRDEVSGSASDAKVPEFIEFIVKDMPQHQNPMRGGLRWLDVHCLKQFEKPFKDCSSAQQISVVDEIAYPEKAKPEMKQGVAFFNLMRNLTATGFYTSQIGVKDIGYMGNSPTQWNGVPEEVLKQYGLAYTEKELKECISFGA